jgi:hypothetical protein
MVELKGRHCDDYISDKTQPKCLRKFLLYKRIPAYWAVKRWKSSWGLPVLFATHKGARVRVNMASRFGDVGITTNLQALNGYELRVSLEELSDFSESP